MLSKRIIMRCAIDEVGKIWKILQMEQDTVGFETDQMANIQTFSAIRMTAK